MTDARTQRILAEAQAATTWAREFVNRVGQRHPDGTEPASLEYIHHAMESLTGTPSTEIDLEDATCAALALAAALLQQMHATPAQAQALAARFMVAAHRQQIRENADA